MPSRWFAGLVCCSPLLQIRLHYKFAQISKSNKWLRASRCLLQRRWNCCAAALVGEVAEAMVARCRQRCWFRCCCVLLLPYYYTHKETRLRARLKHTYFGSSGSAPEIVNGHRACAPWSAPNTVRLAIPREKGKELVVPKQCRLAPWPSEVPSTTYPALKV